MGISGRSRMPIFAASVIPRIDHATDWSLLSQLALTKTAHGQHQIAQMDANLISSPIAKTGPRRHNA